MVADIEELEEDASEPHVRRLNAEEVLTPMKCGIFIFPIEDGTVKISGGDQDLRTSTSNPGQPRQRRRTRWSSMRIIRVLFKPTTRLIMV